MRVPFRPGSAVGRGTAALLLGGTAAVLLATGCPPRRPERPPGPPPEYERPPLPPWDAGVDRTEPEEEPLHPPPLEGDAGGDAAPGAALPPDGGVR